METHSFKKRILPCLLDRLTDRYPKARKESREYRVLNLRQYRLSVARDLEFLFNNLTQPDGKMLEEFSYVRQSVLNYGIKCVSGEWAGTEGTRRLIQAIEEAIVKFEPRILKETLSVHQSGSSHKRHKSKIHFEIEGELWAEPISEKLFIKTEFDLETGECRVT
ncbi:MAG: type VI secretion system baseplate subunit TssE [Desulfobacterales bacterium]|nr:type VI secretion system baseplate subunit TssE [Desulfobacterales bacterium]